ncbi:MAG: hypothetical protein ACJAT3_000716 [Akkermansiaceae bacterium]|jgi:hypothetical protein
MSCILPTQALKALFLGFFCCPSYADCKDQEAESAVMEVAEKESPTILLPLKEVHSDSEKMNPGSDCITVIFEDKCLITPTGQAVLGRDFVINSLSGRAEVKRPAAATK